MLFLACRERRPKATLDWKPGAGASAETAALLVLDKDGMAKVVCLPGRTPARQHLPGIALGRILDVSWRGGPLVAGWAASDDRGPSSGEELVLLVPQRDPRKLAKGVPTARFSPDGTALAYAVARPGNGGAGLAWATSYVLELATGKLTELDGLADPRWEADGRHLRATRLRTPAEDRPTVPRTSLRARWDRESGTATLDGPGTAQIPAPVGAAVAWSEVQRSTVAPSQCSVLLNPQGGVRHTATGQFCMGMADDRAARWSPDGRWLAFPHPGTLPGRGKTQGYLVDVVSTEGGRWPVLTALHARARPEQLAMETGPGAVWLDWSPSGRFLVVQDGANDLRVYDFESYGTADLGKGQRPMWSPGGAYLLVLSAGQVTAPNGNPRSQPSLDAAGFAVEAFVLTGVGPAARIGLGLVRDARWLPMQACGDG
jgi:hypothetical protein